MPKKAQEEYWNNRYLQQQTGWDVGYASPALCNYFNTLEKKDCAILIPGCGNAYEAAFLLKNGFSNVNLLDIAPLLINKLAQKFKNFIPDKLTLVNQDFFEHSGTYDVIIEQTFFCALPPSYRPDYVNKMHQLLKPNGKLAGLLFNRTFEAGPPFGGNKEEYKKLFSTKFKFSVLEDCRVSIAPRAGSELFFIAHKN